MDIAGNNRYELLFMDEDPGNFSFQKHAIVKNKRSNVSTPINKPIASIAKKKDNVEKKNKSGALNKGDAVIKMIAFKGKPKAGAYGSSFDRNRAFEGEYRKVAFKSENDVEQRNERNVKKGGEFGYEQRQFKDRENKPPRNRDEIFRAGKREFDRQSGSEKTGVKAVDKRDGAGAHNWGSLKQEIHVINESTSDADATSTDKEESSNEQMPEKHAVSEDEEEMNELTLDEWKALRGERTKPQYNIRKPNEGEDTSQWKKMVVLNKKKEEDSEEEYEYDPSLYPQRVGRLQRIVDIQYNFKDGRRGGGGFGRARGLRLGGDNKGLRPDGDRQTRQQRNFSDEKQKYSTPAALKVDDERQFPTLS